MPLDLALEARGAAAWAALLLLPGLLVVRAPWHAVPLLSAAFWAVCWGWSGLLGAPRPRFVATLLAAQGALGLLRLLKPWGARRPGGAVAAVLLVAVLALAIAGGAPGPPAPDGSLLALLTRLLVWSQAVPVTCEPLLAAHDFPVATSGLPALAADVVLLSGLSPSRAAALVAATAPGLLLLALYGSLVRGYAAVPAAASALLALAVTLALGTLLGASPAALMALALLVAAGGWLIAARNRSPVVAAGLLAAAAVLTAGTAALLAVALIAALTVARGGPGRDRPAARLAWAAGVAVLAVLPLAHRLGAGVASGLGTHDLAAAAGTVAAAALGLGAGLALCEHGGRRGARAVPRAIPAALALTALVAARVAGGRHLPSHADLEASRWIAARTAPLATFCTTTAGGQWIPALAGRGLRRPCTHVYAAAPAEGTVVYRGADVVISRPPLTTFDSATGNDPSPLP
jgi:hypothetical protein